MPTYSEYKHTEKTTRSFCSKCGSGLTWRSTDQPDLLILMSGSIDEDYLVGTKIPDSEKKTKYGSEFKREGGWGKEITQPNLGNMYWENIIPAMTDHDLGGPKFLQTDQDGEPLSKP